MKAALLKDLEAIVILKSLQKIFYCNAFYIEGLRQLGTVYSNFLT